MFHRIYRRPPLRAALLVLVLLGADVFRRMRNKKIHFHAHDHGDGKVHLHAHSHQGEKQPHEKADHAHDHRTGFPIRALLVGLIHGAAGSAGHVIQKNNLHERHRESHRHAYSAGMFSDSL